MKTILLAAAAVIAMPAIAQTTSTTMPTPDQSSTMQNGQTMPAQSDQTAPSTDSSTMAPPATGQSMPMPMQGGQAMPGNGAQTTGDPAGGYAPPMSPNAGPPAPGQTVTFQQPQSPSQAFPPPAAPTGTLPYCKKGQYDDCRERSTASGARSHRTKR